MMPQRSIRLLCSLLYWSSVLAGQAGPAAERKLQPSVFATLNGTFTGIGGSPYNTVTQYPGLGGRNLTLSAGGDFGFLSLGRYDLALEGRGAYPILKGSVDGQKSLLGGARISREPAGTGFISIFRPYADVLLGAGQITYVSGGYVSPDHLYLKSSSIVYGFGTGFELDVTERLSFKADAQFQQWNTPIPVVDKVIPITAGLGVSYRFGAGDDPR